MTNYRRGYVAENKAIHLLEKEGYFPIRSSGSHTKIDVIGIGKHDIRLIQCKRVKGKYYNFDRETDELKKLEVPSNCRKELWIFLDRMKGRKKAELFMEIA